MNKKIKNIFLTFKKLDKEGLILTRPVSKRSLWFGALLFFVIFGLVSSFQPALAQIPGFSCGWGDLACAIGNFILSVMIKFAVLVFFGIPLLLSALFAGILGLILGWIISPDFISLKFTQNPFVDIGLSITQNFANMGFIIFLVAIALATALRIKEYEAKKTLPTLILVALLINFSPVFCGFIIDASNIVMNFFLSSITGLTGFLNFLDAASRSVWNLLITSGFDVWANISAAMQVIISIFFNFFAGFIFILFSALFIMRYIMLWILVILSPIAFVSYILPVTRRGRSLLSWREWWKQLVAWSIIGITAGFFLYLGFAMISMINANLSAFVTYPDLTGLGLMNNILPYLIPLVLLWIAYKETKRTSAMFAREIIDIPEKAAKSAVMAATIAATAGAATMAVGKLKGAMGTLSSRTKFEKWKETHPVAGRLATPMAKPMQWGRRGVEKTIAPAVRKKVVAPVKGKAAKFVEDHPKLKPYVEEFTGYAKTAGRGLKESLWKKPKEEVIKGFKEATRGFLRARGFVPPLAAEGLREKLEELRRKQEAEEEISEEEWNAISAFREMIYRGETPSMRDIERELEKVEKEIEKARRKPPKKTRKPPEKKKPLIREIETKKVEEEKKTEEKKPPGRPGV